MTTNLARLGLALAVALASLGCSRTHSEAGGDSSTHWLRSCKQDDQCGGLSCVCGVCSEACRDDGQCSRFGAKAVCLSGSPDQCVAPTLVCDAECTQTEDCGGGSVACVDGRCRKPSGSMLSSGANKDDAGSTSAGKLDASADAMSPLLDASSAVADARSDAALVDTGSVQPPPIDAGAARSCAPQRAQSGTLPCLNIQGYAWNGNGCGAVVCDCTGEDCNALYTTEAECLAAYLECYSPSTACSGLPWYQCADHCPGDWNLAGGGRSIGECQGDCSFELSIFKPTAPSGGSCTGTPSAELQIKSTDGQPDRFVSIELSQDAMMQGMRLSRAIAGLALEPVTACPDCVDRGSGWIRRYLPGDARNEQFAYGYAKPPLVLREADRFVQQLIDQARVCKGTLIESCFTHAQGETRPLRPACGRAHLVAETSCCPGGASPLSLQGMACDGTCDTCGPTTAGCHAVCVDTCAGTGLHWEQICE